MCIRDRVNIAVYTGPGRRNPHGGVAQQPCDYSGNCALGCATRAKNTLDVNYLPLAERHGAEIYPLHRVDRIEPLPGDGYRVAFTRLDRTSPGPVDTGWVTAKQSSWQPGRWAC